MAQIKVWRTVSLQAVMSVMASSEVQKLAVRVFQKYPWSCEALGFHHLTKGAKNQAILIKVN